MKDKICIIIDKEIALEVISALRIPHLSLSVYQLAHGLDNVKDRYLVVSYPPRDRVVFFKIVGDNPQPMEDHPPIQKEGHIIPVLSGGKVIAGGDILEIHTFHGEWFLSAKGNILEGIYGTKDMALLDEMPSLKGYLLDEDEEDIKESIEDWILS